MEIFEFLLPYYRWVMVAHIIFVIAFMAGVMYLPRLFIYHHDSPLGGEADEKFKVMERRLLKGIMNPSLIGLWIFGLLMVAINPNIIQGWFHAKFVLVLIMSGIHGFYAMNVKKFERGERPQKTLFWRIMNEVPFILMILIVILVVVKPF